MAAELQAGAIGPDHAGSICRGGTHKNDLYEQYSSAYDALYVARKALRAAEPNGRDYHLQGPTATQTAINEHVARLVKLEDVLTDLFELMEHVVK